MIGKLTKPFSDYAAMPLRLALGLVFLYHGSQKLFGLFDGPGLEGLAFQLSGMGFRPGMVWSVLVASGEFFGGLFVLVGFLTRYSAAVLGTIMTVAVFWIHWKGGFMAPKGFEYPLSLLLICVSLMITGAGKLSVDDRAGHLKDSV